MSDYKCAPECTHLPFRSARAANKHRSSCNIWGRSVAVQAQDREIDAAASGSDEDPALQRERTRKRQKTKQIWSKNHISSKNPASSLVMPDSERQASSSSSFHFPVPPEDNLMNILDTGPGGASPDGGTTIEVSFEHSVGPIQLQSTEPLPALSEAGRPLRTRRLPARYRDVLPQGTAAVAGPEIEAQEQQNPAPLHLPRVILILRDQITTQLNEFGLWREYPCRPSHDPDGEIGLEDLSNLPHQYEVGREKSPTPPFDYSPLNPTQTLLTGWQNNGNATKSNGELDSLARIIQHPDFRPEELKGYNAQTANAKVTKADEDLAYNHLKDSFIETSVEIEVPSGDASIPPRKFCIPQLLYRNLLSVIQTAFTSSQSSKFHFSPFRLFQKTGPGKDEYQRIRTDVYNSDMFLKEHDSIRRAPTDDRSCKREKVVAALMFWSDATHLANFGTAKLWPIYMLFGNLSKYIRASPNSGAVHHFAYIPSIPDSVKHEISRFNVNWKTQAKEIITHCNRELMHAVWRFLLDDGFVHAYRCGIVIKCFDGIERRVYPRFFTYSADYPEKFVFFNSGSAKLMATNRVLLATIRDLGSCPCPRCLIPKSLLDQMGSKRDMKRREKIRIFLVDKVMRARQWIYNEGSKIRGSAVERLLKETSSVPTLNAFIDRLGHDFNISRMLAVDFMHEFELGVWKALFTHLIRVLYAVNPKLVAELDDRFRKVPAFGFDTIRLFTNNASEMKKLAARDFEDLLQCAIPVFEGLLPDPYNKHLMTLLYRTAEWHALAKLRLHTDNTLEYLELTTHEFGKLIRQFRDLSDVAFTTFETDREVAARNRHNAEKAVQMMGSVTSALAQNGRRRKSLNLITYKFHAMGDYVRTIHLFGPTDSYSTQLGELAHRVVKKLYGLGNKKKDPKQIGRRLRRVEWAKRAFDRRGIHTRRRRLQGLCNTDVGIHHHVGKSHKSFHNLGSFVANRRNDPAARNFWPKLQDHFLGRLMSREFDGDTHETFTDEDRRHIRLKDSRFYSLQTLRVNYTTYDVRRDQDSINPDGHADVMMLSPVSLPDEHPYWYARVLGIYRAIVVSTHPKASTTHTGPVEMEFLWVRWMGVDPGHGSGPKKARLPKVGFVHESDPYAFGFLNPAHVIRGCHLLPSFSDGRTNELLSTTSTAAWKKGETDDWHFFYVGIFVDRDMYMRYFPGGGVGHISNREFFLHSTTDNNESDEGDSGDEDDELELDMDHSDVDDTPHSDDNGESSSDNDSHDELKSQDISEDDERDGAEGEDDWQWNDGYGSA
ncbi:hypothetical protein GGU10DRAFT_419733 [Lentinula aff. detonsa]|uniref:Uncharacterized protein n=1 Tax=Lentinula aff. detonsa TaxID=2804958 RepID=A0AA38ND97_9AGAR|nr:hypothetical protein GGU10DRAFT_419733 [Lentinula aff. detonsa]